MFGNKLFCYWLQGFFEISTNPQLNAHRLTLIRKKLAQIEEPLGAYTGWLKRALQVIGDNGDNQEIIAVMQTDIINELNYVFQHDIDNSYDTDISDEFLFKIHNGETRLNIKEDSL